MRIMICSYGKDMVFCDGKCDCCGRQRIPISQLFWDPQFNTIPDELKSDTTICGGCEHFEIGEEFRGSERCRFCVCKAGRHKWVNPWAMKCEWFKPRK